jgi:hypothetical protein
VDARGATGAQYWQYRHPRMPQTIAQGSTTVSTATLSSSLADVTNRIQDTAAEAFRAGRTNTADGLDATAAQLNAGGDRIAAVAHASADSLGSSAKYLRKHDGDDMVRDLESLIKAHPGKALISAVVLGFVAGRAFRRD